MGFLLTIVDRYLGTYTQAVVSESERVAKLKAMKASLQAVKGVRGVVVAACGAIFMTLLLVTGVVLFGWELASTYALQGQIDWDAREWFSLGLILVPGLIFMMILKESTWIKALGLDKKIARLQESPTADMHGHGEHLEQEELNRALDQLIDERISKMLLEREAARDLAGANRTKATPSRGHTKTTEDMEESLRRAL